LLDESDQLAVARGLRDGSREAWAKLYDGYSEDLWRYVARSLGADAAAVADVVQEVFVAAARSARQFDPSRGTLWAWLTGIAHLQIAIYWRQAERNTKIQKLAEVRAEDMQRLLDATAAVDEPLERRELALFVRSVLAELPADYAALLTAKYLDERTLVDLAGQFGGSTETIKSKLARARREFRAKFERAQREPTRQTQE